MPEDELRAWKPTPERSKLMSRVRGKHTKPEISVGRVVRRLGYRFRRHQKRLPGNPDFVFHDLSKVVFVHGCFWHRHRGCKKTTSPKTRREFWQKKFDENVTRDRKAIRSLRRLGWSVMVVWECQTNQLSRLEGRLAKFLHSN